MRSKPDNLGNSRLVRAFVYKEPNGPKSIVVRVGDRQFSAPSVDKFDPVVQAVREQIIFLTEEEIANIVEDFQLPHCKPCSPEERNQF